MKSYKYNYVICGTGGYYNIGYQDIMGLPNVVYHDSYFSGIDNVFIKALVRLTFSKKINKYVHNPFSLFIYPKIYKHTFNIDTPICFIIFGHLTYLINSSYISYLRRTYSSVKIVLFMQDLVSRFPEIDIEDCKKIFDIVLSYDKGDCEKYDLIFHPTPMSYVDITPSQDIYESDVYYLGLAKGRYDKICKAYKKCIDLGLRCDFHVLQTPPDAIRLRGIHYDKNYMSYEENLMRVIKTKVILEIMQPNADGYTPRLWESIVYDKHLITNNQSVKTSDYYNKESLIGLSEFIQSDSSIIKWIKTKVNHKKSMKELLSPIHLLDFIDSKLLPI